jgi:DNA invertase Pin-like site-specific DNA recombinase
VTPTEPRAYSYIRFSTPQQAGGDSLERQVAKAVKWAADNGLTLDTSMNMRDLGVSAFRQKNARQGGALRVFLDAVEDGVVPRGSYLLVENMDRLSRDEILKAAPFFLQIISSGIVVVTLTNGEVYSEQRFRQEPYTMHMVVAELLRSHMESVRKSQLVGDQKARKKQRLIAGELKDRPYTRQTPGWLRWSDETRAYELIPDRQAIVREIFERADQGEGIETIARSLNTRGVPTWGEGKRKADHWRVSYMRKILTSTAPVGTFTPHTSTADPETRARRDVPMDPVLGLFPAAVDEELYWRVRRRFDTTAPRGRNARNETKSVVAGVIKCATCGGTVTRVSKGAYVYLLCSRANMRANACKNMPVPYHAVTEALTQHVGRLVKHAPRGKNTAELDRQIAKLRNNVNGLTEVAYELAELAAHERSVAASQRLQQVEQERRVAQERLRSLVEQRDTLTLESVRKRLKAVKQELERTPLNTAETNRVIRQAVRDIRMDPEAGQLIITWRHAPEETQDVPLFTKHKRWDSSLDDEGTDTVTAGD